MKWLIFISKRYGKAYIRCQSVSLDQRYISYYSY